MNFIKKIFLSVPKKYWFISLALILAIGISIYFLKNKNAETYDFIVAEKGDLIQEVSVTGKVKPASKVDLAFESSGKVAGVFVGIGEIVSVGQKMATLNNAQYLAQYNQALASLSVEEVKLDELIKGTRTEEIDVQKVKVDNAEQSLIDAKANLENKIKDAYVKADDAVRNKADQLFDNPRSSNPQLNFTTDTASETLIEDKRVSMESILNSWTTSVVGKNLDWNILGTYAAEAKNNLGEVDYFLDKLALAVNGMNPTYNITQTTIDAYKTDINTARTNVSLAMSNIITAEEKLRTAESTLLLAQSELDLKESGSTINQIKEQEARVKSAQANADNYRALIAKTIIYSPINGVVTKSDIEEGEIVQANETVFSVISASKYEMEAFIPEADVAKIKIGDSAKVTLDAYEEDVIFEAKVTSIEPAETVVEGVSTYKTILQFTKADERVKSGMTANIDISADERKDVIAVPYRTLHTNGDKYVEILTDENLVEKRIVETGMRGSDGRVEIISGLIEGDQVIIK